jgi:hypothetical protein
VIECLRHAFSRARHDGAPTRRSRYTHEQPPPRNTRLPSQVKPGTGSSKGAKSGIARIQRNKKIKISIVPNKFLTARGKIYKHRLLGPFRNSFAQTIGGMDADVEPPWMGLWRVWAREVPVGAPHEAPFKSVDSLPRATKHSCRTISLRSALARDGQM